jgi:putative FmdB family regulatory protein
MPLYEFQCDCGNRKELTTKIDEQAPACDVCGLRMKRLMSAPAFILKGNCWASDGYGRGARKKSKGDRHA